MVLGLSNIEELGCYLPSRDISIKIIIIVLMKLVFAKSFKTGVYIYLFMTSINNTEQNLHTVY